MVKFYQGIESKPSLVVLNQIEVIQKYSQTPKKSLNQISDNLKEWGFNLSLPIVSTTEKEDSYRLLSGFPIYEAAINAGIDRIWVFLIAASQEDAVKAVEQATIQSKFNEMVIEPVDIEKFLEFINNKKSDLTIVPGIKNGYAKQIASNRPYSSQEDMQKKLGEKRSLNWLRAYKQINL